VIKVACEPVPGVGVGPMGVLVGTGVGDGVAVLVGVGVWVFGGLPASAGEAVAKSTSAIPAIRIRMGMKRFILGILLATFDEVKKTEPVLFVK
jgi:hypothetical protein